MARTDQQAFLDAYLGGGISTSTGRQKIKSAGSTGVSNMEAGANYYIPSLYDYSDDIEQVAMAYVDAAQKQQEAAAKAAQQAAKKAHREAEEAQEKAQEEAKEAQEKEAAAPVLPSLQSLQNRAPAAASAATDEEKKPGFLQGVGGALSEFGGGVASVASGIGDNLDNALAALFPKVNTENAADFAQPVVSSAWQEANAMDAQQTPEWQTAQAEAAAHQAERVAQQAAENEVYRAYSKLDTKSKMQAQDLLQTTIAFGTEEEKEQARKELEAVEKALWNDEGYLELVQKSIDDEPEQSRIDRYLDPSYKLNKLEEKDAKEIIKRYRKEASDAAWWFSGATDEQRREALDKELIATDLETKVSDLYAFESNFAFSVPGVEAVTNAVVKAHKGDDYDPNEDSVQAFLAPTRAQSPIASTAGSVAGNLASYAAGSQLVGAIPGVGAGLQSAGKAIGGTRAAQLASKAPVIGKAFTPEAITGILGDQLVDTVLDTGAGAVSSVMQGDKSGAEIAADAAKNFGTNLAFNIGSAAVLGTAGDVLNRWKANRAVPSLEDDAANQAVNMGAGYEPPPSLYDYADNAAKAVDNNSSFSLDGYIDGVPGAANDVPLPSLENAVQAAQGSADVSAALRRLYPQTGRREPRGI